MPPYDVPFRDTFWNVPLWAQFLLYALSCVAIGVFALGLWQRVALWREGTPENRWDRLPERVGLVVRHALLLVINVTGFVAEACRLAVVRPWWGPWSPVGWALGQGFLALGLSEPALRGLHLGTWVFHFLVSFAFIAAIPYSYFIHLVTTPLNIFFSKLRPQGELLPIVDIEEAESLGVSKLEEFSWKRRLDFDACTMCGRCQDVCPAHLAGTPLNPKQVILKLRGLMH